MKTDLPITFKCSHCGTALRAHHEMAGKSAKCPKCEKTVWVPKES
jgi:DNA-directed RNA polymerase subunit RPC12/RpoP